MRPNAFFPGGSNRFLLFAGIMLGGGAAVQAQSSGTIVELHANKNVTATTIGLPDYPGAHSGGDAADDSSADLGFTFGDIHFRILISKYITRASPAQVLVFYRKPLARYGEVLECEHSEAVGAVKVARGGLTCSDDPDHPASSDEKRSPTELRSGVPERYRIVAIDETWADSTRFSLVFVEKPRKSGAAGSQR